MNIYDLFSKLIERKESSDIDVYYIVENANWSIMQDGINIVGHMQTLKGTICTESKHIPRGAIRHYGSFNVFYTDKHLKKNAVNIVTCFHIVDGDSRAEKIRDLDQYVTLWHTSCIITKNKLIHYGVAENKIVIIPLGIDLDIYRPIDSIEERNRARSELGIKRNQLVIGSFQKDGNGWEEGDTPKLIKGPDIFCDMLEQLKEKYDVFALLSGPARGYVKKRLGAAKIPYYHEYFDNALEVSKLYPLIDIYTVTSREEGGPKAVLESMASGVPVISTKVGMAPELIDNGTNGLLVECEDVNGLIDAVDKITTSETLKDNMVKNGLNTAQKYDMNTIARQYEEEIYQSVQRR